MHAFVWDAGVMRDANDMLLFGDGWVLESATGIDPLGRAYTGDGTLNGQHRSYYMCAYILGGGAIHAVALLSWR